MPYSYATLQRRRLERRFARSKCFCGRPASLQRKRIGGRIYLYFEHSGRDIKPRWHYLGPQEDVEKAGGVTRYLEKLRQE